MSPKNSIEKVMSKDEPSGAYDVDIPEEEEEEEEDDDDGYADFLLSLIVSSNKDEDDNDEDEYLLEDDSDENEDVEESATDAKGGSVSPIAQPSLDDDGDGGGCNPGAMKSESLSQTPSFDTYYGNLDEDNEDEEEDSWFLDSQEIEDELGDLLQEEMEATMFSLLKNYPRDTIGPSDPLLSDNVTDSATCDKALSSCIQPSQSSCNQQPIQLEQPPQYPVSSHSSSAETHRPSPPSMVVPNKSQWNRLSTLMTKAYQLLLQQTVLAIRAAHSQKMHKEGSALSHGRKTLDPHMSTLSLQSQKMHVIANLSAQQKMNTYPMNQTLPRGKKNATLPKATVMVASTSATPTWDSIVSGESADEVAEALDLTLGMLQDLEQNRKDALRYALFQSRTHPVSEGCFTEIAQDHSNCFETTNIHQRVLTRSAFSRALKAKHDTSSTDDSHHVTWHSHQEYPPILSVFDVSGLECLYDTFHLLDNSVLNSEQASGGGKFNLLQVKDNADACEKLLQHAGASYDVTVIPGRKDILSLFTYPLEICNNLEDKPSPIDVSLIRKARHLFTRAEDILLLRGVNLYGEKEWVNISYRFMPDRGINLVSQRFGRLCVLVYEAHGIQISLNGDLDTPRDVNKEGGDNNAKLSLLKPVPAPAFMNVLRWSLFEDIAILKAVPIVGHSWADIASLLIPHRMRGHLRKRYQVLERRVKATMKRISKIPVVCGALRSKKDSISKEMEKKNVSKSIAVGTKSKKISKAITIKAKSIPQPMMITVGTPGGGRRNLFPLSQGLSKTTDLYNPLTAPTSMVLHKYVPHGFSASVIQQTQPASQAVNFTPTLPSAKNSKKTHPNNLVSKLNHPWPMSSKSETAVSALQSKNLTGYEIQKKDDRETRKSRSMMGESNYLRRVEIKSGSGARVNDEFHIHSSPVATNLNPTDNNNSPTWSSPRNSVLSLIPTSNTNTSMDRFMEVEGFVKMWGETIVSNASPDKVTALDIDNYFEIGSTNRHHGGASKANSDENSNSLALEDFDDSCTGLSLLKDPTSPEPIIKRPHRRIMSSVMSYAHDKNVAENSTNNVPKALITSKVDGDVAPTHVDASTASLLFQRSFGLSIDQIDISNISSIDVSKAHSFDDHCGFTSMFDGGLSGCNSLLPTEFDAIAVLNQMSSSNVPFDHESIKYPQVDKSLESVEKIPKKRKGSLFSQVVRGDGKKKIKSK